MIPADHPITIKRGDTFSLFARARDKVWDPVNSVYVPGDYKDITGWTGTCQLRTTEDAVDVEAVATITLGNQEIVPGSFFMTMTPAITGAIVASSGVYDIQFVTPAGEVHTYVSGEWTLSKDVTRE